MWLQVTWEAHVCEALEPRSTPGHVGACRLCCYYALCLQPCTGAVGNSTLVTVPESRALLSVFWKAARLSWVRQE